MCVGPPPTSGPGTPFGPSTFSYDFVWRILNIFKIFNFYILAVKEAGDSATYEKYQV